MTELHTESKARLPANMGRRVVNDERGKGPFERLVELVRENDDLLIEFQRVRAQSSEAIRYLAKPGASSRVAGLWLERLRIRRQKVLDRWDHNHRQLWALGLLDHPET